ncbi:MAG: SDR family oxidoreductase [Christensenellales bacterium]|jgi:NAD(P)-dependent dehydrogenase (short-subunit alcohol dehydrogenase family)
MDQNSVVIVTGANSGMGKATCLAIARHGANVVMLCRSRSRGEHALKEVREISKSSRIELMICDLGDKESIEDFCMQFKKKYHRLDVLVNNAGVLRLGYHKTADGFEQHFGVNHLGHFLLTNRLLDLLVRSAPSRIINVSSCAHKIGRIHFNDVDLNKNYSVWRGYAQSKLANVLFTYELAERLAGTGVTANCLHPGIVATNIVVNRDNGFGKLIARLQRMIFTLPEIGIQTAIYLAASPEVEGVSGRYFCRSKAVLSSKRSYDKSAAKKLWELSEKMMGLNAYQIPGNVEYEPIEVDINSISI